MFAVIATILVGVAALVAMRVTIRRERRLIEARRRRALRAVEFETRTGMYAPGHWDAHSRVGEQSGWELAR